MHDEAEEDLCEGCGGQLDSGDEPRLRYDPLAKRRLRLCPWCGPDRRPPRRVHPTSDLGRVPVDDPLVRALATRDDRFPLLVDFDVLNAAPRTYRNGGVVAVRQNAKSFNVTVEGGGFTAAEQTAALSAGWRNDHFGVQRDFPLDTGALEVAAEVRALLEVRFSSPDVRLAPPDNDPHLLDAPALHDLLNWLMDSGAAVTLRVRGREPDETLEIAASADRIAYSSTQFWPLNRSRTSGRFQVTAVRSPSPPAVRSGKAAAALWPACHGRPLEALSSSGRWLPVRNWLRLRSSPAR